MGCASSKPASSSKKTYHKENNKTSADKNKQQSNANNDKKAATPRKQNADRNVTANKQNQKKLEQLSHLEESIKLDQNLLLQIDKYHNLVIEHIVKIVRRELNAELISNGTGKSANLASLALVASAAHDNDDLITDISSKAITFILTGKCSTTYRNLNDTLKTVQYLCKNQTHKYRICDLVVETIRNCLASIHEETRKSDFNLYNFLIQYDSSNSNNQIESSANHVKQQADVSLITPPESPENFVDIKEKHWENVVLLSRAEASEIARKLFLSNRARPIIHLSPKIKDAYFVNKQLDDNTEITVTQQEINDIMKVFDTPLTTELNAHLPTNNTNTYTVNSLSTPVIKNHQKQHGNLLKEYEQDQADVQNESSNFNNQTSNSSDIEENNALINNQNDLNSSTVNNDNNDITDVTIETIDHALISNELKEATDEKSNETPTTATIGSGEFALATLSAITALTNSIAKTNDDSIELEEKSEIISLVTCKEDNNNNLTTTHYEDADTTLNTTNLEGDIFEENGQMDPVLKQSLLDDRFYNNDSFKTEPPVNGDKLDNAATTIQSGFKGHTTRQELKNADEKVAEAAATTIQATYRGFKTRRDLKLNNNLNMRQKNENVIELDTVKEEQDTSQVNATISTNESNHPIDIESSNDQNNTFVNSNSDENLNNKAAIKIQASYRGFRTRKELGKVNKIRKNNTKAKNKTSLSSSSSLNNNSQTILAQSANEDKQSSNIHNIEAIENITSTLSSLSTSNNAINESSYKNDINKLEEEKQDQESKSQEIDIKNSYSINENSSVDNTDELYQEKRNMTETKQNENNSDQILEKAATKIQSTFRGYNTRKKYGNKHIGTNANKQPKQSKNKKRPNNESEADHTNNKRIESGLNSSSQFSINDDLDKAATKIQSTFRGYKTRLQLNKVSKSKKILKDNNENNHKIH